MVDEGLVLDKQGHKDSSFIVLLWLNESLFCDGTALFQAEWTGFHLEATSESCNFRHRSVAVVLPEYAIRALNASASTHGPPT